MGIDIDMKLRWPKMGSIVQLLEGAGGPSFRASSISPISLTAMTHAAYFNRLGVGANEEESIVADSQSQFLSCLKSFYVARTRLCETVEGI
jgi:hypothetical protein